MITQIISRRGGVDLEFTVLQAEYWDRLSDELRQVIHELEKRYRISIFDIARLVSSIVSYGDAMYDQGFNDGFDRGEIEYDPDYW